MAPEEAAAYPADGMFVHGLVIEGARWALGDEAGESYAVGDITCAGFLTESKLKQLLPAMPLIYLK